VFFCGRLEADEGAAPELVDPVSERAHSGRVELVQVLGAVAAMSDEADVLENA
jgi:hypothetical protein